jgi:ferritin-like metal-binding protein YciE
MSRLRETFLDELADIYDAEHQLTRALPKIAKAAENDQLKAGFEKHLLQTKNHIERLDRVFQAFGEKARSRKCKAMKGLIQEGEERIGDEAGDAALIAAAQKVEHYEIAGYGSLKCWAELLGRNDAVSLLEQTLQEEKATDAKLTEVAQNAVNLQATQQEHEHVHRE